MVDGGEQGPGLGVVEPERLEVEEPQVAIAQPHIKIILGQPEAGEALDE